MTTATAAIHNMRLENACVAPTDRLNSEQAVNNIMLYRQFKHNVFFFSDPVRSQEACTIKVNERLVVNCVSW